MSIVRCGAAVHVDVLEGYPEAQTVLEAVRRDAEDVRRFIVSLKPEEKFFQLPVTGGEAVNGWVPVNNAPLGALWTKNGKHVRPVAKISNNFNFFTPRGFVSELWPGVTWRMKPAEADGKRGATGSIHTMEADKATDDTGKIVSHKKFALKVMCSSEPSGGSAAREAAVVTELSKKSHAFIDSIPASVVFRGVPAGGEMRVWGVAMELADGSLTDFERPSDEDDENAVRPSDEDDFTPLDEENAVNLAYAMFQEVEHMWRVTGMLHTDIKGDNFLYILTAKRPNYFTVSMADYESLCKEGERLQASSFYSPLLVNVSPRATWAHVAMSIGIFITSLMDHSVEKYFIPSSRDAAIAVKKMQDWVLDHDDVIGDLVCTLMQYDREAGRLVPTQPLQGQEPPRIKSAEDVRKAFDKYFESCSEYDRRVDYPEPSGDQGLSPGSF